MARILFLKRPFIWIKRFRHRRGYGVHSPFAYDLITSVIYENRAYYAYKQIETSGLYKKVRSRNEGCVPSKKLNRLLFRLVNRLQPTCILQVGDLSTTSLYLQAGCKRSKFACSSVNAGNVKDVDSPDFMYIPYLDNQKSIRDILQQYMPMANSRSVYVIGGIGYTKEMKKLWEEIKTYHSTGITFDLYDAGIIFFDNTRTKQHYIVNF